jgi:hypothetical protein
MNSRATASITTVRVILAIIGEVLRRDNLHSTSSFMAKNHNTFIGSNRSLTSASHAIVETKSNSLFMKGILTENTIHILFTGKSMAPTGRNLKQRFRKISAKEPLTFL